MNGGRVRELWRSAKAFINGHDDSLPWTDSLDVKLFALLYAISSEEQRHVTRRRLLRVLVHSEQPENVQCGITILQASLPTTSDPRQKKKEMYLLAVGHYRIGDYSKSKDLVSGCLQIAPRWSKATVLRSVIEKRAKKDKVQYIVIAAVKTVGIVASVLSSTTRFPWGTQEITFRRLIEDCPKKAGGHSLPSTSSPMEMKDELYLLAYRHYKRGDCLSSRCFVVCCLMIAPGWRPAVNLKKSVLIWIKTKRVTDMCKFFGASAVVGMVIGSIMKDARKK